MSSLTKILLCVIAAILLVIPQSAALGQVSLPPLLVTEIQTESSLSASEEFVEISNPTDTAVVVDGYTLHYVSASGATTTLKATLMGTIWPGGSVVVATAGALPHLNTQLLSGGLATTGGHIKLSDSMGGEIDRVGWGTAAKSLGSAAPAPKAGSSIARKIDHLGYWQHTASNAEDFGLLSPPGPDVSNEPIVPPSPSPSPLEPTPLPDDPGVPTPTPTPGPTPEVEPELPDSTEPTPTPSTSADLDLPAPNTPEPETVVPEPTPEPIPKIARRYPRINEMMPDPLPPFTDADDEWIELYNPFDEEVSLEGLRLTSGVNGRYTYVLAGALLPHHFMVIASVESKLVLSNSGSTVVLFDIEKNEVVDRSEYTTVKPGKSWALDGLGIWRWTSQLSPMSENVFDPLQEDLLPATTVKSSRSTKPSATPKPATKTAVKSSSTKSPTAQKAATTAKPKSTPKTTSPSESQRDEYQEPPATSPAIHPGILATVALFGIGYTVYDYRESIARIFRRIRQRRHARHGRIPRAPLPGI